MVKRNNECLNISFLAEKKKMYRETNRESSFDGPIDDDDEDDDEVHVIKV